MYRIAICNDQKEITASLLKQIPITLKKHHIYCDIQNYSQILTFYKAHLFSPFHLLIINTDFSNGIGIKNCQFLRQFKFYENIIILSSSTAFFKESATIFPLCYLLTPINTSFLEQSLLYNYSSLHFRKSISFHNKQGLFNIPFHKILYLESKRNYLYIHTTATVYHFKYKIDDLSFLLQSNFIRCHQSFIVNIHYITTMERYELAINNHYTIPISKRYSQEIRKKYQSYLDTYSLYLGNSK